MVSALANQNLNYLVSGEVPERHGNAPPNIVPYQVFAVSDGHITPCIGNDGQFLKLCEVLRQRSLATNPRFVGNTARVQHRNELVPRLEVAFASRTHIEILRQLEQHGIPAEPLNRRMTCSKIRGRASQVVTRPGRAKRSLRTDPGYPHADHVLQRKPVGDRASSPAGRACQCNRCRGRGSMVWQTRQPGQP